MTMRLSEEKVPMTKEEVRAVSIARMELTEDAVVYDVGAGSRLLYLWRRLFQVSR
mgnify:CR=1 FL=1